MANTNLCRLHHRCRYHCPCLFRCRNYTGWGAKGLLLLITLLCSKVAVAEPLSLRSLETRTPLLELYTSQGCYSCPPAENWLNRLTEHKQLWTEIVPIALHVDYWDYLGWKDSYGATINQRRHFGYKLQGLTQAVYTPQMILNGRDWLNWKQERNVAFERGPKVGVLEMVLENNSVALRFQTEAEAHTLRANVALLGFDIVANIKAGENKGKSLHHEFVALARVSGHAPSINGVFEWQLPRPQSELPHGRQAIVAWLDRPDNNMSIQALGAWLPSSKPQAASEEATEQSPVQSRREIAQAD